MRRLVKAGVDGILTDVPEKLMEILGRAAMSDSSSGSYE